MSDTGKLLTLTIESMAFGGKGIARVDGKVFFVLDAIPGDVVEAIVKSDSGRYADATLDAIVQPSPHRGPSPCEYSTQCGGCQWLGVPADEQLEWKRQFVASSLKRIGKLPEQVRIEISGSREQLGYRNRVHLKAEVSSNGKLLIGYFKARSTTLVAVTKCMIADRRLDGTLEKLSSVRIPSLAGTNFKLELQVFPETEGSGVTVTFFPNHQQPGQREALKDLVAQVKAWPGTLWAGFITESYNAPYFMIDEDLGLKFFSKPGMFQQVNIAHNRAMRAHVRDIAKSIAPKYVLDVCCGSGNFSLALADGPTYIEGVESSESAINCAKHNVRENGLANTNYLVGDATKHLWKCARGAEEFDLVILDPPREGLYEGMIPLIKIAPKAIIYISCDPSTLARDLGSLCRSGYEIADVKAFDFFPNTFHVETVVYLKRA